VEPPPLPDASLPESSGTPSPRLEGNAKPKWRSVVFLLIVGFYPLLIGVFGHYIKGVGDASPSGPALPATVGGLLEVCLESVGLFGVLFAIAWLFGRPGREQLFWRPMRWWDWLWGALWSVGVRLAAGAAVLVLVVSFLLVKQLVQKVPPEQAKQSIEETVQEYRPKLEATVDFHALENPVYVFLALTLVSFVAAGMREELWRAGFMSAVHDLLPASLRKPLARNPSESWFEWQSRIFVPAVIISSLAAVVFGLGHLPQGIGGVVLTGVVGFVLGMVMICHRSLWTAVIAHGFFDAATFALLAIIVTNREALEKMFPGLTQQLGM
jgi:membrane protease YdiL (CAAX protease family)